MNSSRRLSFAAVPALALAACTPGSSTTSGVQKVMLQIQFTLPFLDALVAGIAVAVPSSAPAVNAALPWLADAGRAFQTLTAAMTDAQGRPIVQQIEGYVAAALQVVSAIVAKNPQLAGLAPKIVEARAVLALLVAFVSGVSAMPTAAAVRVELLHR
jgi:hypothetical protein